MKDAKYFLVVRFSVEPQAEAQVLGWLDGGHVKEVAEPEGIPVVPADSRLGANDFSMLYGIESSAAFEAYEGNKALKEKFARERAPFEKHMKHRALLPARWRRPMLLDWNTGLVKHLGIRFLETEKDRVVAELEIRPELLTTNGALHGGTLMAFADTIGAAGTVVNLAPGQNTATLESKTNFFAAARSGTVRAESTPLHKGKRTHVWQTRVTDAGGKLLSLTIQTQVIL